MRDLDKFARLIVEYSAEVSKGDEVVIRFGVEALPFVRTLVKAIVERGGYPRLELIDEETAEIFFKYATREVLEYLSPIDKMIAEKINVMISVISFSHTKYLVGVDPERIKVRSAATRELSEIFMRRDGEGSLKWTVTIYPTRALAQEAGMSILDYEEFIYRALKLYAEDPVAHWREIAAKQEKLAERLSRISEIRVVDSDTDLTLSVAGRRWVNDDGKKNMPGGEVFTGPVEESVEGYIAFTYPSIWRGYEVEGVKLVFRRGEVVEATAVKGEEFLKKMLETDEGARRVGEFAFGLNYDIRRFTKQILLDEKIGGTIHLALGSGYHTTGSKNRSAIHWDMIKDTSKAKIYGDGDLIYENGRFLWEVL
ncbi:MAG: aminopeptidase [Acidilobaceae archaeon]